MANVQLGHKGEALAELRARTALRAAGLDPTTSLVRASSVTNEVWLTPTHVVRVNRTTNNRLAREAKVVAHLPPEVGYPRIVAHGGRRGEDWLVSERLPGVPLAHAWPDMSVAERRSAVRQLAGRLAALHRTLTPIDLPPIERAPHLLDASTRHPTEAVIDALHRASHLPHIDPIVLHEAIDIVRRSADALVPFSPATLVHGDLTFENVLWHDGEVTAVLDVEWARGGPADLDLDIILRCCTYPKLHVAYEHEARTNPEDYALVPKWLAEDYPELFAHPRQLDRLRVYSIAYDVRDLLAHTPNVPARRLPRLHPYHRLLQVVEGQSHLDVLASFPRAPLCRA